MTDDTRPDLATVPSAAEIVRYMRATGWTHGRQGSHGAMWTRGDVEFSVPHEDDRPAWLREVVGRLASAEGRTPEATAAAVAAYRDAGAATKDCGCGPLEPCGEHLGRGSVASVSTSAVTSPAPDSGERPGAAMEPVEGGWRERAEQAEARLAEVRQRCQEAAGIADLITRSGGKPITASPLIDAILAITGTGEEARDG